VRAIASTSLNYGINDEAGFCLSLDFAFSFYEMYNFFLIEVIHRLIN